MRALHGSDEAGAVASFRACFRLVPGPFETRTETAADGPPEGGSMSKTRAPADSPAFDWVLVANASRARCFVRDADNGAMREDQGFIHEASRLKGLALAHDRDGKVRKSAASTQFAPHTDRHQKEHASFARELADFLERAALAQSYPGLSLVASAGFLGELRAHLGPAAGKRLRHAVALDLSSFQGAELEHRVTRALAGAAPP
jgi:protein required for attachment to host cells